jgi:hypothetical protein
MNYINHCRLLMIAFVLTLTACQSNPQNVNVALPKSLPEAKETVFEKAIIDMGTMTEIYSDVPLRVMANHITDNTGTSTPTQAEIPRDITAMVKSTLNAFGGNVIFIPYNPNFMANTMNTGYTQFENKIIPDIIIDGGITEFDRGLETKGDSTDVGIEGTFMGGKAFGFEMEDQNKGSLARVTLDFNIIDFTTFAGIPQMQAINTMKLHKAIKKDSIGFSILSSSFGASGSVKKVQGRHAAIRLLVQLSMVQLIGKYRNLPYWRILPGSKKDINVINRLLDDYYSLPETLKIAIMQKFLALNGYALKVSGVEDRATLAAKEQLISKYQLAADTDNGQVFVTAYINVPITRQSKYKSRQLSAQLQQVIESGPQSSSKQVAKVSTPKHRPFKKKQAAPFNGKIELVTNKSNYNIGEKMLVSFTVDEPMYVRLVVVSSDGSVATLFPNAFQSDNYCKPGKTYQVPPPGNTEFTLSIGEPRGVDKIRALGSKVPVTSGQIHYSSTGELDTSKITSKVITAGTDIRIK